MSPKAPVKISPMTRSARLFAPVALLFGLALAASAAVAQNSTLTTLSTSADAAGWQAVGRLDVAGRAFCTAVMIGPDVVLTAAHCLFDPHSQRRVTPGDVRFHMGFRNGTADATLRAEAFAMHPEFSFSGDASGDRIANDLALIRLAGAAPRDAQVFTPGKRPRKGSRVAVVSYGKGRAQNARLEDGCQVLARRAGKLVLNCDVAHGSSGAPVFQRDLAGNMQLVSVISSAMELDGTRYALGTDLERPLALLTSLLAQAPGRAAPSALPKIRRPAATGSGAKFVRP